MRRSAALIVGGGPAGSAAAIGLARGGIRPLLIERTRETGDALCGGFLSWRTLDALAALGVAADDLNPARITRVRLMTARASAETPLPRPALAVSRRRLDSALLARAAREDVAVERGVAVRALADGTARLGDGGAVSGDAILLATGKHDLRGTARDTAADADPMLGIRVRLASSATLERLVGDAIELHLFDGGYAGLARQEDGGGNLCLAVRRSRLRAAGDAHRLLARLGDDSPLLGERLAALDPRAPVDAVANIPYGWLARDTGPGLYRLGDQAGVIPSLAGEGMGIAIASGTAAARAIIAGVDSTLFQRRFARTIAGPIGIAGHVARLAARPATAAALVALARLPFATRAVARLTRIKHSAVDAGPR